LSDKRVVLILLKFKYSLISFGLVLFSLGTYAQNKPIEISGDVIQIALPAAAFSSALIWTDESKPVLQFIKGSASTFLLTHGLKRLIDKPRPNGGSHAFPSGHASMSFYGAAFLDKRFGWKVGVPAYAIASYGAWTRVHTNHHDYWDVAGGALLGIGMAYLFAKPFQATELSCVPFYSQGLSGITVTLHLK
jgi:membrane-associated phospholipid phosphatase